MKRILLPNYNCPNQTRNTSHCVLVKKVNKSNNNPGQTVHNNDEETELLVETYRVLESG